ncbi:flagellin N-terminal helical domain-containing protein [Bacillus cereus group sp. BY105LC]|uniref:flagellin N-terminal helical domain-containing protein n=1 Tax=Bacillus cereus group sp. BY105LC TaxID=3018088 RepID=UPI0022DEAF65|nr:flagellin [Bacillus cereus group sp. BY105LC]MDA1884261.1 flagellin [Bacillus cereus group sp. BY105LC]
MRINTNINSMRTQEYMRQNQAKMSNSMDRLSSGKRINNASDDAAGLAIATRMRARESGLGVAANNTQDGISLIRTADSAMNSVSNILLRMRDLANQSANGTNTDKNQTALDKEFAALKEQIDYISKNTEFNDKKLLDGSNKSIAIQTLDSFDKSKQIQINLSDTSTTALKINGLSIADVAGTSGTGTALTGADALDITATKDKATALKELTGVANSGSGDSNGSRITSVEEFKTEFAKVKDSMNKDDVEKISAAIEKFESTSGNNLENAQAIGKAYLDATTGPNAGRAPVATTVISSAQSAADVLSNLAIDAKDAGDKMDLFVAQFDTVKHAMSADDVEKISAAIDNFNKVDGSGKTVENARAVGAMFSAALAGKSTSSTTGGTGNASAAVKAIDAALEAIASNRATLGATLNRLDFNVNNLKSQQSSMASAASQVEDADMAKEMSEMTKFKILNEAGISMLSQANQTPQMVSKLLQ